MRKKLIFIITSFIFVTVVGVVVYAVPQTLPASNALEVTFLDVGQGDAILIEAPNDVDVLIDGGRTKKILDLLSAELPFGDDTIDVVIATHPDADHVGGLPFVLDTYTVDKVFEPGVSSSTQTYQAFQSRIRDKKIERILARRGMRIVLDAEKNIVLDILYPDRDTTGWETNEASIVARLSYGTTSFLLTGDSPIEKELYLVKHDGIALQSSVLKLGHHGSKTSSSESFLKTVAPLYTIISAGKNNSYGHPHPSVLSRLTQLHIPYLETSKMGSIRFVTDGVTLIQE
ncbi:MBL fold metallo-hydrolase [Candidatus Nomurabacteria bacterium]|nr:MBL fold metallo-hydrolase [Candidatus Nomurabacteria bacterium]